MANDFGFADHASFTRAFKEAYGITPDEFRCYPVILNQFIKPDLLLNYVTVDEDIPLIADGIVVEVIRRKLDETRMFIDVEGELPDTELTGGSNTGIATAARIWDRTNEARKPSLKEISAYVNSPLFDHLCSHVETEYQSKPVLEYSRCSMQ